MTTLDLILYHASRYLTAEAKYKEQPTGRNKKLMDSRYEEMKKAVGKISIKQGELFKR